MSEDITDVQIVHREPNTELERMEKAQIDQLVSTSKQFPRNVKKCKDEAIAMATMDIETACECFYTLRRAGKLIEGPSVRAAEIAFSCWGNLRAGSRVLGADATTVTGQAFCHDTEKNVYIVKETKRRITTKDGKRYNEDMILTTGNAAAAISQRNAVFGCIPKTLIRSVYKEAKKVAIGDASSLHDRWNKCIKAFTAIPVTEDQILKYLEKKSADEIVQDDLAHMIGVFNSLKEGEAAVDELFPPEKGPSLDDAVDPKKEKKKAKVKDTEKEPATVPEPETKPEPEPEVKDASTVVDDGNEGNLLDLP